jgi:hypothetical protein
MTLRATVWAALGAVGRTGRSKPTPSTLQSNERRNRPVHTSSRCVGVDIHA